MALAYMLLSSPLADASIFDLSQNGLCNNDQLPNNQDGRMSLYDTSLILYLPLQPPPLPMLNHSVSDNDAYRYLSVYPLDIADSSINK